MAWTPPPIPNPWVRPGDRVQIRLEKDWSQDVLVTAANLDGYVGKNEKSGKAVLFEHKHVVLILPKLPEVAEGKVN